MNGRCCRNRMREIKLQNQNWGGIMSVVIKKKKCSVSIINKSRRRQHFHESPRRRGSKYFPANPSVLAFARPLPPSPSPFISCSLSISTAVWWEDQGLQRGWVPQGEYQQPCRCSAQRQPPACPPARSLARPMLMSLGTWLQRKQPTEPSMFDGSSFKTSRVFSKMDSDLDHKWLVF